MAQPHRSVLIPGNHPATPYVKQFSPYPVVHRPPLGGELYVLSWSEKIDVSQYSDVFVIHESALPEGRGWSPLAWQVLEGKKVIPLTMIRAVDEIDAGPIMMRRHLTLDGSELYEDIHRKSAFAKCLMLTEEKNEQEQLGVPTYYPRRYPKDSEIDPDKSLREQFNLLRICDPRFPAFFTLNGHKYELTLKRL